MELCHCGRLFLLKVREFENYSGRSFISLYVFLVELERWHEAALPNVVAIGHMRIFVDNYAIEQYLPIDREKGTHNCRR